MDEFGDLDEDMADDYKIVGEDQPDADDSDGGDVSSVEADEDHSPNKSRRGRPRLPR